VERIGEPMDSPGSPRSPERALWLYDQLLRVERHWTEQLQNQQTRAATTLSVNGIMLAFLAGGGFISYSALDLPAKVFLFLSVLVLAAGIVCGLFAIRSRLPVGGRTPAHDEDGVDYFLSSKWFRREGRHLDESDLLRELSESLESTEGDSKKQSPTDKKKESVTLASIVTDRRTWLFRQQKLIGVAAFLLIVFVPLELFY
jgi:hypothetical protein